MKASDFRIGWRLLFQEPAYAAVVLLGLSLGLTACILLLGFVRFSFTYNSYVSDHERVYSAKLRNNADEDPKWSENLPISLREVASRAGAPVVATAVLKRPIKVRVGTTIQNYLFRAVDPEFGEVFGVEAVVGDLSRALTNPNSVALTRGAAQRLFGPDQAFGEIIEIDQEPYKVEAIVDDPPANSTIVYSVLGGIRGGVLSEDDLVGAEGRLYFKLAPDTRPEPLARQLQRAADLSPESAQISPADAQRLAGRHPVDIQLVALPSVYFDPDFAYAVDGTNDDRRYGNMKSVLALAGVAVLILLLATANYVNLATIRTLRRRQEIGLRKLLGASRSRIAGQFLAESIVVAFIATAGGLILAWLMLPTFSELMMVQRPDSMFADVSSRRIDRFFEPSSIALTLLFGVCVGLLSGAYPAWVAIRLEVSNAISGRRGSESASGLWLRRILTVLQFSTAIGLSSLTIAVALQARFAITSSPGFQASALLMVSTPFDASVAQRRAFRSAVARIPGVLAVAMSENEVGVGQVAGAGSNIRLSTGEVRRVYEKGVSPEFFAVYRVRPLAGRVFDSRVDSADDRAQVVANATAARILGLSPSGAVGQVFALRREDEPQQIVRIVGVVPDIRHQTLREQSQPLLYVLSTPNARVITALAPRRTNEIKRAIEAQWRLDFPNDVGKVFRLDDFLGRIYAGDQQRATLLVAAALITMGIAAFGIYVLSAYNLRRRTREIVIRKLYGATAADISWLVSKEFFTLVAISALIALPIAATFIERHMSSFVVRAHVSIAALGFSLIAVTVIALLATLRHTLMAMKIPPAIALRD